MRLLLALLAVALLVSGVSACGGAGNGARSSSRASGARAASDARAYGDYHDSDDNESFDNDRISVRGYGHEATGAERSAIVALVKRYYAAAARGDGARACTMIYQNIARAAPVDYGQLGPPYLHGGRTCAAVLSLLFEHYRRQLTSEVPKMQLTGVRLEGDEGFALLRFGTRPERQIALAREGATWRIEALLDDKMRRAP